MKRFLLSLALLPLLVASALAQATIQASPTRLDAALQVGYATAAVNNQVVNTIVVPAGLYAYITSISFDVAQNNTGTTAANNAQFTSSGINGNPIWSFSLAGVANSRTTWSENFQIPLKSGTAGTNVVITSPAANATATYTTRVYYYLAP
jgi:hypothetical protein